MFAISEDIYGSAVGNMDLIVGNFGSVAEFVGKKAVEKAASRKSPKAGLSLSAWKSRESDGISPFPTAPTTGSLSNFIPERRIAELQQASLVCC